MQVSSAGSALVPVPGWHPMVVHFPLALLLTAGVALTVAKLVPAARPSSSLAIVGTWNLVASAVAALFALGTGVAAVVDLHVAPAARLAIAAHVKVAMFTVFVMLLLAVWRGAGSSQEARPSWIFLLILWVAMSGVLITGYRGGQNVYVHGIGVKSSLLIDAAPCRASSYCAGRSPVKYSIT